MSANGKLACDHRNLPHLLYILQAAVFDERPIPASQNSIHTTTDEFGARGKVNMEYGGRLRLLQMGGKCSSRLLCKYVHHVGTLTHSTRPNYMIQ